MTIVNDNNDHGHGLCSSDKHRHHSDVGMWHVYVINYEEYKLYKCRNYIINFAQANILTQHDQPHPTFMLYVSTHSPRVQLSSLALLSVVHSP